MSISHPNNVNHKLLGSLQALPNWLADRSGFGLTQSDGDIGIHVFEN